MKIAIITLLLIGVASAASFGRYDNRPYQQDYQQNNYDTESDEYSSFPELPPSDGVDEPDEVQASEYLPNDDVEQPVSEEVPIVTMTEEEVNETEVRMEQLDAAEVMADLVAKKIINYMNEGAVASCEPRVPNAEAADEEGEEEEEADGEGEGEEDGGAEEEEDVEEVQSEAVPVEIRSTEIPSTEIPSGKIPSGQMSSSQMPSAEIPSGEMQPEASIDESPSVEASPEMPSGEITSVVGEGESPSAEISDEMTSGEMTPDQIPSGEMTQDQNNQMPPSL